MISFQRTSDEPEIAGIRRQIASSVDLDIPTGRYALLTSDPLAKKPAVDLLAGLRPPQVGRISFIGLTSWPIGRPAFAWQCDWPTRDCLDMQALRLGYACIKCDARDDGYGP